MSPKKGLTQRVRIIAVAIGLSCALVIAAVLVLTMHANPAIYSNISNSGPAP